MAVCTNYTTWLACEACIIPSSLSLQFLVTQHMAEPCAYLMVRRMSMRILEMVSRSDSRTQRVAANSSARPNLLLPSRLSSLFTKSVVLRTFSSTKRFTSGQPMTSRIEASQGTIHFQLRLFSTTGYF